MGSDASRVTVEVGGGVADVRLNRPERHNALDQPMFEAIRDVQRRLAGEPVRAVVLSGEGPSFCSGLDVGALAAGELDFATLVERSGGEEANLAQLASHGWRRLPVPTIAAIDGACFGGGIQIALGADLRIGAESAKLSVMEVNLGLLPDMGISVALPRLLREDVAKELTFSGRVVDGREALELGLLTRLAERPREAALELAGAIAARSPDAVRTIKRLFDEAWAAPPGPSLKLETQLMHRWARRTSSRRCALRGTRIAPCSPTLLPERRSAQLPGLGPRQLVDELDQPRVGVAPDAGPGHLLQLRRQLLGRAGPGADDDRAHDLAVGRIVGGDDRGLGDLGMAEEDRLDLSRAHVVAGGHDQVVVAPDEPEVAVLVAAEDVAGREPFAAPASRHSSGCCQ